VNNADKATTAIDALAAFDFDDTGVAAGAASSGGRGVSLEYKVSELVALHGGKGNFEYAGRRNRRVRTGPGERDFEFFDTAILSPSSHAGVIAAGYGFDVYVIKCKCHTLKDTDAVVFLMTSNGVTKEGPKGDKRGQAEKYTGATVPARFRGNIHSI
jgi:hypothetical protein